MSSSNTRTYPQISINETKLKATRPLSFIVIKFSGDYEQNFLKSECIHDQLNQVITVENTRNVFFDNLSQAIIHGIEQAIHDLIVVVHEDVMFPRYWQLRFEQSLSELEKTDSQWGLLGSVGWRFIPEQTIYGHVSDPNGYVNTFTTCNKPFKEVEKLDEQILIMHKSRMPVFDPALPSIHFLGEDLPHSLHSLKTYVIDAPTIHKYADEHGNVIMKRKNSPKIKDRRTLEYLADFEFCLDYFKNKWPDSKTPKEVLMEFSVSKWLSDDKKNNLRSPLIVCSNCKVTSKWLFLTLKECGFESVFLTPENDLDHKKKSIQKAFYHGILAKFKASSNRQIENISKRIYYHLAEYQDIHEKPWALFVHESDYLLNELSQVFKHARYVFIEQKTEFAAAENNHFAARLDNQIGRTVIPASYDYFNLEREMILSHTENDWNVINVLFREQLIKKFKASLESTEYVNLYKDSLFRDSSQAIKQIIQLIEKSIKKDVKDHLQKTVIPISDYQDYIALDKNIGFWKDLVEIHKKNIKEKGTF